MNIANYYIALSLTVQCMATSTLAQFERIDLDPELVLKIKNHRPLPDIYQALELSLSPIEMVAINHLTFPINQDYNVTFELEEYQLMQPKLAIRYPHFKTYIGINEHGDQAFVDITSSGLHAVLHVDGEVYYIDPIDETASQYLISYKVKDYPKNSSFSAQASCGNTSSESQEYKPGYLRFGDIESRSADPVSLRTYVIAVATTYEYCLFHGGTTESAMAAMVTAFNRVNSVYNVDLATRFVLHENTDALIFCSSDDPYTNGNTTNLIDENPQVIRARLSVTSYDIGHVLCTNAGGIGQIASVCDNARKDRGVSCHPNPINDPYHIGILSHELGHQFGANHIFNGAIGSCADNISTSTAYEPGSGTTIMSYAGICGSDNVSNFASPYYNAHSLNEIKNHIVLGLGGTCAEISSVDNTNPEISIVMENDLFIPISTPFELFGTAIDNENDELTYVWEQHDLGIQANLGSPVNGRGPLFRSIPPSSNPNRVFPNIVNLLDNIPDRSEILPTITRPLSFLYTVRDNNENGGGVSIQEFEFNATDQAGPFVITSHNQTNQLEVGEIITIEWDVANTNLNPINCEFVDIVYSTDGGFNFDQSLAKSTSNNGHAIVSVPDISTNQFRYKVKASENIFFDINNANTQIIEASQPTYLLNIEPYGQTVCAPSNVTFNISTTAIQSFDIPIVLSLEGEFPSGVEVILEDEILLAGQSTQVNVNLSSNLVSQHVELFLLIMVDGQDTMIRPLVIDIQSTDFSEIAASLPADGLNGAGISQIFDWKPSVNAESYLFQLSDDPTFDNVIYQEENISGNEIDLSILELDGSTTYYWRIRPSGICGLGPFTETYSFKTLSFVCQSFTSQDVPLTVNTEIDTAQSILTISDDFKIEDLNVVSLEGAHANVGDLIFQLISPNETVVRLFSRRCNQLNAYDLNLDDDVLNIITCPMDIGRTYKPLQVLSIFNGEQSSGQWTLQMIDAQAGNGGILNGWGIEFCTFSSIEAPILEINESISINPLSSIVISNNELLATDLSASASELIYTIVNLPVYGDLILFDLPITVGESFSQVDINEGNISYIHLIDNDLDDQFKFSISNPGGGWLGGLTYTILLNEVVNTTNLAAELGIKISPNPSSRFINISVPQELGDEIVLDIFNINGRRIISDIILNKGDQEINISHLMVGTYILLLNKNGLQAISKIIKLE